MRKLIFILLLIGSTLNAQNVVYVSFQPSNLGVGLRYDRLFNHFGLYVSGAKGNYKLDENYVKDHYKLSFGATKFMTKGNISAGISYHHYGEVYGIGQKALKPVSFDIGGGTYLGRLAVAIRMDLLKGDGCVDVGLKF